MNIGQRMQFSDGQRGVISAVFNGGLIAEFQSDTGAVFMARDDELSEIGSPIVASTSPAVARVVVRFERQHEARAAAIASQAKKVGAS